METATLLVEDNAIKEMHSPEKNPLYYDRRIYTNKT